MANAYTQVSNLGTNLVQAAYDRLVEFKLRAQPLFRTVADKRPAQQAMPGSSVVFQLYNDLSAATSTLTETVDPDAVSIAATDTISVTLNEYGNAVLSTRKLSLFSLSDVDPAIADMVAFNLADSLDSLVLDVLRQGTNVIRYNAGTLTGLTDAAAAVTTMTSASLFTSAAVRGVVAKLRTNKAVPRRGSLYAAYIHPEVSHDLRAETGNASWTTAHQYAAPDVIWPGEIGTYEGAYFMETPRCYNAVDSGATSNTIRNY